MPFPTFVRGYFQKGKKDMKKRKRTDSYPVAPFTIFDVANMLDMEFLENCKNGYQVKDVQNAANVVCPFCGDARGKASICVCAEGKIINVFHCFDCGTGHNMLTLYAELCHLTGKDRILKIFFLLHVGSITGQENASLAISTAQSSSSSHGVNSDNL